MKAVSLSKIQPLLGKPSFTSSEAKGWGVGASVLSYYVKRGDIERISHGVYRGIGVDKDDVPFEWEDLVAIVESIPTGRVCLISALALYDLTEEIPRHHWIAVPHEKCAPRRPGTKVVRMRDMMTGSSRLKVGDTSIRIFDRERTILDAFRFLSPEIAIKALKRYLSDKSGKPDLKKLQRYSRKMRVPIQQYVEALTA